jgi:hypothetical protein
MQHRFGLVSCRPSARREARSSNGAFGARDPYEPPRLTPLGDLRDLTLGGSVGRGDSGAVTRQARIGGP